MEIFSNKKRLKEHIHLNTWEKWLLQMYLKNRKCKSKNTKSGKAHHPTAHIYNKKSISTNARLRQYKTLIQIPYPLYGADCPNFFIKNELEKYKESIKKKLRF